MDQCLATTKLSLRCKRPAADDCAGYCKPHFDDLPPEKAGALARRAKAKKMLKKLGKAIGAGVGAATTLKEIWDIVGPLLSRREVQFFEVLLSEDAPGFVKVKALHGLVRSMNQSSRTVFRLPTGRRSG